MSEVNKTVARIIYEQVCGTTNGHMAPVPNSPIAFSIFKSVTGSQAANYACTFTEFSEICSQINLAVGNKDE